MRPLVVVRSSKAVPGPVAMKALSAFISAAAKQGLDVSGKVDLTKTNRERISNVSDSIIADLERVKAAILEEQAFTRQLQVAPPPGAGGKRSRHSEDTGNGSPAEGMSAKKKKKKQIL